MIPTPQYYPVEAKGRAWMTLRELEGLGAWNYYRDGGRLTNISAYAALACVGRDGGFAKPANGMDVTVREIDMTALLGEMGNHGPTPNDGAAS